MSWVINFKYPTVSAKAPNLESQPVQVSVSAIGAVTLEHIKFPKTNYDVWKVEGFVFLAEAETGRFGLRRDPSDFLVVEPGQPAPVLPPPSAEYQDWLGLKEFDWVNSELFRGTIKQGRKRSTCTPRCRPTCFQAGRRLRQLRPRGPPVCLP